MEYYKHKIIVSKPGFIETFGLGHLYRNSPKDRDIETFRILISHNKMLQGTTAK